MAFGELTRRKKGSTYSVLGRGRRPVAPVACRSLSRVLWIASPSHLNNSMGLLSSSLHCSRKKKKCCQLVCSELRRSTLEGLMPYPDPYQEQWISILLSITSISRVKIVVAKTRPGTATTDPGVGPAIQGRWTNGVMDRPPTCGPTP